MICITADAVPCDSNYNVQPRMGHKFCRASIEEKHQWNQEFSNHNPLLKNAQLHILRASISPWTSNVPIWYVITYYILLLLFMVFFSGLHWNIQLSQLRVVCLCAKPIKQQGDHEGKHWSHRCSQQSDQVCKEGHNLSQEPGSRNNQCYLSENDPTAS